MPDDAIYPTCGICNLPHPPSEDATECRAALLKLVAEQQSKMEHLHDTEVRQRMFGSQLEEEKAKHKRTQEAFEYAIHRYWMHYDQFGPYWMLFTVMTAVICQHDDKGDLVTDRATFLSALIEAKAQLAGYHKWQESHDPQAKAWFMMEDEMIRLREIHQTALNLLRGGQF